jgi:epoxyqueuosine reductase QueG
MSTTTDFNLKDAIEDTLGPFQPLKWGVCAFPPDGLQAPAPNMERFEKVLIIAVPFVRPLPLAEYAEPVFKHLQTASFARNAFIAAAVRSLLSAKGIRFSPAPHSKNAETFERNMNEGFSTKESARRAGLGWMGRSNLLVTPEFGPQINMIAFFLDAPLEEGQPIDQSRCGNCRNCVDNCPLHVIKGKLWMPGIKREEQVDFETCSKTRLKTYEHLGRKITCAKCVISCPHGWKWTKE